MLDRPALVHDLYGDEMIVDRDHPLAVEYRCHEGHIEYILVPWGAWPLPYPCKCGKVMYPLGSVNLPEKEKSKIFVEWEKVDDTKITD